MPLTYVTQDSDERHVVMMKGKNGLGKTEFVPGINIDNEV